MKQNLQARGVGVSVAVHCCVAGLLLVGVQAAPRVAPYKLPGTARGVHLLTYFSPGAAAPAHSAGPLLAVKTRSVDAHPTPAAPKTASAVPSQAEKGMGTSAVSGLGDGDITMALQKVFPPPHPDLSTLAPGHHGEVVLNAVIDEQGRIRELTVLRSLTPAIDDVVVATVQSWTYQPATRNGMPVASEQELHFYYERG